MWPAKPSMSPSSSRMPARCLRLRASGGSIFWAASRCRYGSSIRCIAKGEVAAGLKRLHNQIEIIETNVGVGYQTRRARNPQEPGGDLGAIAVDEYATALARSTGPNFVPLVLFEDPDVMELRIARLKGVHLLNTTAWLLTLHREGLLPEALELVERINSTRATPLVPFEKNGLTKECGRIGCAGASDDEGRKPQRRIARRRIGKAGEGQDRPSRGNGVA